METAKVSLPIFDLSLGGCGALTIEHVLRELDGVVEAYVNPATETAYLTYEPRRLPVHRIADAIRALGYETDACQKLDEA